MLQFLVVVNIQLLIHATDCHNTEERAPKIEENLKTLFTFCSREQIEKILKTNPDRIWFSGKTSL